ncbi:hypothetical protein RIF29_17951 [Crotalaria pallida]|uniref:Uncharacterized protein n=1 Tax=Crotalaria pallida TaxID=3830 RepID=A0AAN9IGX8_CROPI
MNMNVSWTKLLQDIFFITFVPVKPHHLKPKKMPQSLCNFPTRTKPQTTLKSEDSPMSSTPTIENMHKSTSLTTSDTKQMAEFPPVEIGTRGTVASLIMQEIQYFRRIELSSQGKSQRNKSQMTDMDSSVSTISRGAIVLTPESTKKKRVSSKLLPSMCSMVDVSDNGRPNGTSAFSYRNLKSDTKRFGLLSLALLLLLPLLLASCDDDFLGCDLLGVVVPQATETGRVRGLLLEDTCLGGAEEM